MNKIIIKISKQRLYLYKDNKLVKEYLISTSKYGIGNKEGSNKTPLGIHCIKNKIGRDARIGEIFRSRRRLGKIARSCRVKNRDLITTRILRLEGLKKGVNRGKGIDSYRRCIYIHGTPEEHLIGKPASHGCIRMKNTDIVLLFNLIKRNDVVDIRR